MITLLNNIFRCKKLAKIILSEEKRNTFSKNCEYLTTEGDITKIFFPSISERLKNKHLVLIFMLHYFSLDMKII